MKKLFVLRIADGFDTQKGSIFGFGTHAEDEPESVFNISSATQDVKTNWKKLKSGVLAASIMKSK